MFANLIIHHGISDDFDQTREFIRIFDIVKKAHCIPLLSQQLEFSKHIIKLPNGLSGSAVDPRKIEVTFRALISCLAPSYHPQERSRGAALQGLRPGVPTILSLVYSPSYAGELVSTVDGGWRR